MLLQEIFGEKLLYVGKGERGWDINLVERHPYDVTSSDSFLQTVASKQEMGGWSPLVSKLGQ